MIALTALIGALAPTPQQGRANGADCLAPDIAPLHRDRVSHVMVGIGLTEQFWPSSLARLATDLATASRATSECLDSD
jgi:hypothetical protein